MPEADATNPDWREKYRDCVREIDELESLWRTHVRDLAKIIAALASGNSRGGDIAQHLDTLTGSAAPNDSAVRPALRALVNLAANGSGGEAAGGVNQVGASILEELQILDAEALPVPALNELGDTLAQSEISAEALAQGVRRVAESLIARASEVRHDPTLLVYLLDQLSLPGAAQEKIGALIADLAGSPDNNQALVDQIADTLTDCFASFKDELQGAQSFMQAVNERLAELNGELPRLANERAAAAVDRTTLSENVDSTISAVHRELKDATEIDALRGAIDSQLDTINGYVTSYIEKEQMRADSAEQRALVLEHNLCELQRDSEELRTQLARAQEQSSRDALTGLPNRLAYDKRLEIIVRAARNTGETLSLTVFDIDRFKTVNDTYGHLAGDRLLKIVAQQLRKHLREGDFLARYGGEEFVVLLPNTNGNSAADVADLLRRSVEQCRVGHCGKPLSLTISAGIAEHQGSEPIEATFERADRALYEAKESGRNCVKLAALPRH
ncbi:MAG: diguanylate cyclase [Pseudomonadota bacterium]